MVVPTLTISQGDILVLHDEEVSIIYKLLKSKNLSWDYLDAGQMILKIPQQYVGYIGLPTRKIIIKPKHAGVTLNHILRIYYFLYSAELSDLDTPMYDVEESNNVNLISLFINELHKIIQRGVPIEYTETEENLRYARGQIDLVRTRINILLKKKDVFHCAFDDLSCDIPINRLLIAALNKVESITSGEDYNYLKSQFPGVNSMIVPDEVITSRNTSYCKKAVSLAYMILNDLVISSEGENMSGESLLINFDYVFEEFVKKILMEYSGDGNYLYWGCNRTFGMYKEGYNSFEKSYKPDLIYGLNENGYYTEARAILDMKNKTSKPFNNADIYQMVFYAKMLNSKKVLLCYPANYPKESTYMKFDDEKFFLQKIYAVYINLVGNSAKEFKNNVFAFIENVQYLL